MIDHLSPPSLTEQGASAYEMPVYILIGYEINVTPKKKTKTKKKGEEECRRQYQEYEKFQRRQQGIKRTKIQELDINILKWSTNE